MASNRTLVWKWRFDAIDTAATRTLGFLHLLNAEATAQLASGAAQIPKIGMRLRQGIGLKPRDYSPYVAPTPALAKKKKDTPVDSEPATDPEA